jgi:hypothetical protein
MRRKLARLGKLGARLANKGEKNRHCETLTRSVWSLDADFDPSSNI